MIQKRKQKKHGGGSVIKMGLQKDILECQCCKDPMIASPVVGSGNPNADIMIIAQNPCHPKCIESGVVFTGGSGILLDKALKAAGLTREDVWITNVVKCSTFLNQQPTPDMKIQCLKFLARELNIIRPRLVITLGKYAVKGFPKSGLYKIVSLLHPVFYLRTGKPDQFIKDFSEVIKKHAE